MPACFRELVLVLACLALAETSNAGPTLFGPQLDFPVPGRDVGSSQLGIGAGLSLTTMESRHVGVGLDVVYHYWPASTSYVGAFDRFLRSSTYQALDGSEWAFPATQLTAHLKFVAPGKARWVPWAKLGAGYYWLGRNIDERPSPDAYITVAGDGLSNTVVVPGGYGSIGVDLPGWYPALGLDATFHYVRSRAHSGLRRNDLPDFAVVTMGMHLSFGGR